MRPSTIVIGRNKAVDKFVPPDNVVGGFIQEGFLYSLFGSLGGRHDLHKVAVSRQYRTRHCLRKSRNQKEPGAVPRSRNPIDVQMRWKALAQQMDVVPHEIDVYFIEGAFRIGEMIDRVKSELARVGGEFGLVVVDTGPVFFEGDDENSRKQQGDHAELMRSLITLVPGRPAVVVNCHPVKNASSDNLLPAGGGNFLNQVDGNLTAAKTDSTTTLHWQGKFRGVEFAPMHFLIRTVTHEELKDRKGRLIPTVICEPISDTRQEELEQQAEGEGVRVLDHVSRFPNDFLVDIARAFGWTLFSGEPHKTKARRAINHLKKEKLLRKRKSGRWRITKEGKEALKEGSDEA